MAEKKQILTEGTFVDTSAWYALISGTDDFHSQARSTFDRLTQEGAPLHTSEPVLSETMALLTSRFNKALAIRFGESVFGNPSVVIHAGHEGLSEEAWLRFKETPGKTSFVDCHSFALMTRLGLIKAFTFDEDFKRQGFAAIP